MVKSRGGGQCFQEAMGRDQDRWILKGQGRSLDLGLYFLIYIMGRGSRTQGLDRASCWCFSELAAQGRAQISGGGAPKWETWAGPGEEQNLSPQRLWGSSSSPPWTETD